MKTSNINSENLTEGQNKAIALLNHLDEKFFLLEDENENKIYIYSGEEEEERENFKKDIEGTEEAEIDANFLIFCMNNCVEIPEIEADEERDGYIVLTDDEADEKVKEYILDTVWAFNASFLSEQTGIDKEVFEAIQNNDRCESNNKAILSMIDDEDDFVQSAISADGRGHFMSSYDRNENEETVNDETFYIYRIN